MPQTMTGIWKNPAPSPLPSVPELDFTGPMIRPGFLDSVSQQDLIELARDRSAAYGLVRGGTRYCCWTRA